jgi:hypothetical protein
VWGSAPVDFATQFVDASYGGNDSDGSEQKPWTTVQAAVDAATNGGLIAIASGRYDEDIVVGREVTLWGRCATEVELAGVSSNPTGVDATLTVLRGAGASLVDVGLSGPGHAVAVTGALDVRLERVWLHDSGDWALRVDDELGASSVTLDDSLLEQTASGGIIVIGAALSVNGTTVRDARPNPAGLYGRGVDVASTVDNRASVSFTGGVVERVLELGIFISGADATIGQSVVRAVYPEQASQLSGRGIGVQPLVGRRASLSMSQSLIAYAQESGIFIRAADFDMETSVVRDTTPNEVNGKFGRGITIQDEGDGAVANIRRSLVDRNHDGGVFVGGSELHMEGTLVRGTLPRSLDGRFGRGVIVQHNPVTFAPSSATVVDSRLQENHDAGLSSHDGRIVLERTSIVDTRASAGGLFGDGLSLSQLAGQAQASVAACALMNNARAGIANFGGAISLEASSIQCNVIDLDGEDVGSGMFSFDNRGGNVCGCSDTDTSCKVQSSGLAAPDAPSD